MTCLYPSYGEHVSLLNGLMIGVSYYLDRRPFASNIAYVAVEKGISLQDAVRQCGVYDEVSGTIPKDVRHIVRNRISKDLWHPRCTGDIINPECADAWKNCVALSGAIDTHRRPSTVEARKKFGSRPSASKIWSGRRDSNPRPQPWQGCALPLSYARAPSVGGAHHSDQRRICKPLISSHFKGLRAESGPRRGDGAGIRRRPWVSDGLDLPMEVRPAP